MYGKFPVYIMLSGLVLIFSLFIQKKHEVKMTFFCWWLVISFVSLYGIQIFTITTSPIGNSQLGYAIDKHRFLIFTMPIYVLLGLIIPKIDINDKFSNVDKILLLIILFAVITNTDFSLFRLDFGRFIGGHAVYLVLGDMLAMVGFYYIVKSKNLKSVYFMFLIFLVCLFLIYSRTSLYFYCLTASLYLLWLNPKIFFIFISILCISTTLILNILNLNLSLFGYGINRMFFIFSSAQDSSANQRVDIMNSQMGLLYNNWYIGDFGGQVSLYGKWGAYMHNFISIWRQFGLLTFMLYAQFAILATAFVIKFLLRGKHLKFKGFPVLIMLYSLLCIMFSRSYIYPYFYIYFGCVLGLYLYDKNNEVS